MPAKAHIPGGITSDAEVPFYLPHGLSIDTLVKAAMITIIGMFLVFISNAPVRLPVTDWFLTLFAVHGQPRQRMKDCDSALNFCESQREIYHENVIAYRNFSAAHHWSQIFAANSGPTKSVDADWRCTQFQRATQQLAKKLRRKVWSVYVRLFLKWTDDPGK